jgi:hypothetical protein
MHRRRHAVIRGLAEIDVIVGCTGFFAPSGAPNISFARLAITSFRFMLVWVPEPVCHTTKGK